jgi:uncharacterized protein YutE (UPF0331/DUF86 family)
MNPGNERLLRLETNVRELRRFRQRYTLEEIRQEPHLEWSLRYGLLEAIQIVIDISCHIVSRYNLGVPDSYAACMDLLRRNGFIDEQTYRVLLGMVGLRNILVHEYAEVNIDYLYSILDRTDDFVRFIQQIRPYI